MPPKVADQRLTSHEHMEVKKKKIWDISTSPRKQMMMTIFMMWMAGNELHIFPIMITGQALYSPINSIFNASKAFERAVDGIETSQELQDEVARAKMFYILHQIAFLAIGVVKCYYLGLVPTNSLDWIDHNPRRPIEMAYGAY